MFKKLTFLTAMFLLSFTLSVGAAGHDQTLIQQKQENFIDTADVSYAPYHGKLEVEGTLGRGYNGFVQEVVSKNLAHNVLVEYVPHQNLQVDAFFSGNVADVNPQGFWFDVNSAYFYADAKYKFFHHRQLEMAVKGFGEGISNTISYQYQDGTKDVFVDDKAGAFGVAVLSNYNMGQSVLYNHLGVNVIEGTPVMGMTNGFKTSVNQKHTFMGKLDTLMNTENQAFANSAALMYKAQVQKNIVNLLEANYNFNSKAASVVNTLEARVLPKTLLTGQFSYTNAEQQQNSIGFAVENGFGAWTVQAGMDHKFEKDTLDPRTTIKGGVEYDVNQNVEVSLNVEREMVDPAGDNNHNTRAKIGLKVDL